MPDVSGRLLARRDLLKRGAVVGGTVVWTVPGVQALTMTSSTAAVPSGTPGGGGTTTPGGSGTGGGSGVDTVTIHRGDGSASGAKGAAGSSSGSQPLASTGPAVPVGEALVYGVGAVAVGGALLAAGRSKRPSPVATGAPGAHRRPQLPRT